MSDKTGGDDKTQQDREELLKMSAGVASPRTTEAADQTGPDEGRTGKYGGDDGALEHENAETNTPEDTGSKVEPGRKAGR